MCGDVCGAVWCDTDSLPPSSLYQSLIGQLLFLKATIEGWRSTNVFGTLMASVHECALVCTSV